MYKCMLYKKHTKQDTVHAHLYLEEDVVLRVKGLRERFTLFTKVIVRAVAGGGQRPGH